MSYRVSTTDNFRKEAKRLAKKHASLKGDLSALGDSLAENPEQGVSLGKGCYKVRMAVTSKGKGKSGGARVITYVYVDGEEVFLLSIYDKSDQESITDAQIKALLDEVDI